MRHDCTPGITPLAYVPPHVPMKNSEWPTLGEMIDDGKRVVVFLDSGTDTSQVEFILPEFEMASRVLGFLNFLGLTWDFRSGRHPLVLQIQASRARSIASTVHYLLATIHI